MTYEDYMKIFSQKNFLSFGGLMATLGVLLMAILGLIAVFNKMYPTEMITSHDTIVFLGFVALAIFLLWIGLHQKKRILPVSKKKFNVALAIKKPPTGNLLFDETLRKFTQKFEEADKYKILQVFNFYDPSFRNPIDAERFIADKGIQLLIWGDVNVGKQEGDEVLEFSIKFTYSYSLLERLTPEEFDGTHQGIQEFINGREWKIFNDQSFTHIKVVSSNFAEVALFITVHCLISNKNLFLAHEYVSELLIALKSRKENQDVFTGFEDLYRRSIALKIEIADALAIFTSYDGNYDMTIKYSQEVLTYRPKDLNTLITLARGYGLKGDMDTAFKLAMRAKKLYPQAHGNKVNEAYFHLIRDKDYDKAVQIYRKLPEELDCNIWMSIDFLEREYDTSKDISLLFAAGYLNMRYMDKERGFLLLKSFERVAVRKDLKIYKPMLDEIKRLDGNRNKSNVEAVMANLKDMI